jgi:hypothetical protein
MRIMDRADRLRILAIEAKDRDALETQAMGLQSRVSIVDGWIADVRGMLPALKHLGANGAPATSISGLSAIARGSREVLAQHEDPTALWQSNTAAATALWGQTPKTLAAAEARLLTEWSEHVARLIPAIDPAIVRVLAGPEAASVAEELNRLLKEANYLSQHLPATDAEGERAAEVARSLADTLHRLGVDSLPGDVREFVEAALQRSATLAMLTPDVLAWLKERGLESNVRIAFDSDS